MNPKITSSFIPDKIQRNSGGRLPQGGIGDMVLLLGVVVLFVAAALALGIFLYDRFLAASVATKGEQLNRAREQFDPVLIQNLARLDARMNAAYDILARHLAPSEVFRLLQDLTLQSILYDSLDYTIGEDGIVRIDMSGVAQSVNGVALQSSLFGEHNAIMNPIFSGLNLTDQGVEFSVSAVLDPVALQYARVAEKRASGVFETVPPDTELSEFEIDPFATPSTAEVTPSSTSTVPVTSPPEPETFIGSESESYSY